MSNWADGVTCPLPYAPQDTVQMAHGGGGRTMKRLIDSLFRPAFENSFLAQDHDGAVFETAGRIAMTTDSYVVRPLFFPGGDIGSLAVHGTVNDLAMCGARALYLSVGFVLEEGLSLEWLHRIVHSMAAAATATGTQIVTGDVKVVDRSKADGLYVNITGVGQVLARAPIGPASLCSGDAIIVSGDLGRHGVAVMNARHGLGLQTAIESDSAALIEPVEKLLEAGLDVHCMRDLTRGGLASALVEIAESSGLEMNLLETAIPVRDDVRAACELLGLDPVYVPNEGRFVLFLPRDQARRALAILNGYPVSQGACIIGEVTDGGLGRVVLRGHYGVDRLIDMLSGDQLPRIC